MRLSMSDLQTKHRLLVEALKRGESVQLTYRGKVLGVVSPESRDESLEREAMDAFFGMHRGEAVDTIEQELRTIRRGRQSLRDV